MDYKYVVFSPYFGKLPDNFNLWLKSCLYNAEIKFIVFTDDNRQWDKPINVEIIKISFEDFKEKIQKKFDFKISLDTPYKLCDFKPTYGYAFPEYIEGKSYWGYCDLDIIFGNLLKFLPINEYDKISYLGHFCLYKNNPQINSMFKKTPLNTISYIDILSNPHHFGFDEIGNYGINSIFKNNNLNIFNYEVNVADINCRKTQMNIIKYENEKFEKENINKIFIFEQGKIYSINYYKNKKKLQEYAYIHLQKRKMKNFVKNEDEFLIVYNAFIDFEELTREKFNSYLPVNTIIERNKIYFLARAIKNRFIRFNEIKKILRKKNKK